jgi:CBS domain containing-hemolysin-like protein
MRALGDAAQPERPISVQALGEALERSARQGLLAPGEADLLAEIIELSSLRVREIMTPRVDVLVLDLEAASEEHSRVQREAMTRRHNWLPVVRGGVDNVEGFVELRKLVAYPERSLAEQVMPVKFVPEVARVLAVLQSLREDRVGEAVVIDEYGGMAGVVTLERIFEELVGDLRVEGEALERPVVPLGEDRFRVLGSLSIRDWNDAFGSEVVPTEFESRIVTGAGRIPVQGDRVELESGSSSVHEVRGRRAFRRHLVTPDDPRSTRTAP